MVDFIIFWDDAGFQGLLKENQHTNIQHTMEKTTTVKRKQSDTEIPGNLNMREVFAFV